MTGKQVVFYGAGLLAKLALPRWIEEGLEPICFVDSDRNKQGTLFPASGGAIPGERQFPVISLEDARVIYPDADYFISARINFHSEISYFLTQNGVPAAKIRNYMPTSKGEFCDYIGTQIAFLDKVAMCCEGDKGIDYLEELGSTMQKFDEYSHDIASRIAEGKPTYCDGCVYMVDSTRQYQRNILRITFASMMKGSRCNFNCCYCAARGAIGSTSNSPSICEVLEYACRQNWQLESIHFSAGEFCIDPDVERIVELIKMNRWESTIYTNASMYVEGVADLMHMGIASLYVSLDAGTPETFAKVKGVNLFRKVSGNLKKYALSKGRIDLKYLILPGLNDTRDDIEGFIALARDTNTTQISISNDMFHMDKPLPREAMESVLMLIKLAHDGNMSVRFDDHFFHREDIVKIKHALKGLRNGEA